MKDLTEESIGKHILQMVVPIAAGMFFQTLYFLVDLYFAAQPNFALVQLWYVSVASVTSQALVSLWLVRREFQRRLGAAQVPAPAPG